MYIVTSTNKTKEKKMEIEKLFKVLVVGGSLMASAGSIANQSFEVQNSSEEETLTFCSIENEKICVENEEGEIVVKEGFECCWGTSCS